MFGDINQVELMGNITNDITIKYTPNGKAVTNFGLATNRRYKNGPDGEWKDEATFHNIVVWGGLAEGLSQRAKKGTRIYIQGRLQTRTWDDKDGKKNYKTEIVTEKAILIDRYDKGSFAGQENRPDQGVTSSPGQSAAKPSEPIEDNSEINPDDLPF